MPLNNKSFRLERLLFFPRNATKGQKFHALSSINIFFLRQLLE